LTTPDPAELAAGEDRDPAWYRNVIESKDAKITELEGRLTRLSYKELNLDPTEGIGKAVALTFEGDTTDPASVDALKAHAADLGWKADEATPPVEPPPTEPTTTDEAVSDGEGRIKQLESASTPAEPNALEDEAEAAEAAGDVDGAIKAHLAKAVVDGTVDLGGLKS
jgi:hypothetical protein